MKVALNGFFIMTKNLRNLSIYNVCLKIFSINAPHVEIEGLRLKGVGFTSNRKNWFHR